MFFEAIQMVQEIVKKYRIPGYLGWDIAVSEDGPVLIEFNTDPAPSLNAQPMLMSEGIGTLDIVKKYLP